MSLNSIFKSFENITMRHCSSWNFSPKGQGKGERQSQNEYTSCFRVLKDAFFVKKKSKSKFSHEC